MASRSRVSHVLNSPICTTKSYLLTVAALSSQGNGR